MKLAVCILHYGQADLTARLHGQFLRAGDKGRDHVFVLDNASPEPYADAWHRLPENLYWGGALAWALDSFRNQGYSHLWFCNNDMVFVSDPPYYERGESRIRVLGKRGRVGVYSPAATSNPYHGQMVARTAGQCRKTAYVDGIAPVISLECVDDIGGLDLGGNVYGYGVDVWFSLRAFRKNWGVWVDDSLVLRHKYHVAARDVTGFLAVAAKAENEYLTERLGPGWRDALTTMQHSGTEQ